MSEKQRLIPIIRVSTQGQATEGVSLEAQLSRLQQWADLNGYEWSEPVELPGVSGKSKRTEDAVRQAIARLRKDSGDALAAYSLSRMSRSTRNLMDIADEVARKGCNLVSLTENLDTSSATGKLVFRILSVLAEFERDIISERTKTALKHLRSNGLKTGGKTPYGYRIEGDKLVEDPEEQGIISAIRDRYFKEKRPLRNICSLLNESNIPTRSGGPWQPSTVRKILNRKD